MYWNWWYWGFQYWAILNWPILGWAHILHCDTTSLNWRVNTGHYWACHFFASLSNCRSLLKSSGPSLKWSFCIALHLRSPVNFYASGNEYGQYSGALLPIHLASTVAKTPLSVKCHQFTISKIAVCLIIIVILEHKFSCWQCDLIQSN